MKVCFVLPKYQHRPVGGYKMVYEYANRFVDRGINVDILYMNTDILDHYQKYPKLFSIVLAKIMTFIEPRWFVLDKRVKKLSNFNQNNIDSAKEADVIIATAITTVDYAFSLSPAAKHLYYIQDYEAWGDVSESEVYNSYKTLSKKIVISKWLKEIVDVYSPSKSKLISNPIDLNVYHPYSTVLERKPHTLGVLYHTSEHKGFSVAYQVINQLHDLYNDLEVYMFGGFKPEFEIPEWIHFTLNATQNETVDIYNQCRVFLCTSVKEGFGLTGLEAMACGCVLISTDYEGVKEYAINNFNALLSPISDCDSLIDNCCIAYDNDDIALQISENGIEVAANYSWDKAVTDFINEFDIDC